MKLKTIVSAVAIAAASVSAQASGVLLSEGFNNVPGLTASGWAQVPTSGSPGSGWFQGNAGIFEAASGAANSYAAANFVDTATGTLSDWLFTPVLSLASTTKLFFDLRLLGADYLDTVEVYASTAGSSTTAGDFTLLGAFSSRSDTGWVSYALTTAGFDGSGRIGFRFTATAGEGNYVGLDNVVVAVPEPASLALVGLALAGVAASTRRRSA